MQASHEEESQQHAAARTVADGVRLELQQQVAMLEAENASMKASASELEHKVVALSIDLKASEQSHATVAKQCAKLERCAAAQAIMMKELQRLLLVQTRLVTSLQVCHYVTSSFDSGSNSQV